MERDPVFSFPGLRHFGHSRNIPGTDVHSRPGFWGCQKTKTIMPKRHKKAKSIEKKIEKKLKKLLSPQFKHFF